ncbi:hypothetical protein Patl1_35479 [Pistacia atlantica]|nr:hypothetical protein Patl1_35479 [Pistacia atlantica]
MLPLSMALINTEPKPGLMVIRTLHSMKSLCFPLVQGLSEMNVVVWNNQAQLNP